MRSLADKVQEDALRLTEKERANLAYLLLRSLDGEADESEEEVAAAWDEELDRRVAEVDAGEAELIPWEEVKRQALALLANRKK